MMTKYILKQQINYREGDEIINKPLSCTELECNEYQSKIPAYNIDDNQKMNSKDSYLNQ